jgi:hypothetical protein
MNTRLLDRKYKYYHKQWYVTTITEAITVRVVRHYSPTPRTGGCVGAETTDFVCVQ